MGKADISQKIYFEEKKRFADLWNGIVFGGEQKISWQELEEDNAVIDAWDKDLHTERSADLIMKRTRQGRELAILILENQKTVDYSMPARVLLEEAMAYEKQVRQIKRQNRQLRENCRKYGVVGEYLYHFTKKDKLKPISTLVLFWGEEWDGATSLHEMLDFTGVEEMKGLVQDYNIHVINMSKLENTEVFQTDVRDLAALYIRRNDKAGFQQYLREHWSELEEETIRVLANITASGKLRQCIDRCKAVEKEENRVCKAFEEWMEEERMEGKREGIKEGIKEGIAEGIQESIVLHIEAAMESFHLSLEEACMGLRTTVEEYQRAKKSIHKLHQ